MTAPTNRDPVRAQPHWSWPHAFTIIALVAIVAATLLLKSLLDVPRDLTGGGRQVLKDLRDLAEAFQTQTVTTSFISYASEVTGSSYLQFATLKQMEVFERTDSRSALWGQLQLPDVVVQATAPVEYTYYLDLDGKWQMRLEGHSVLVIAPPIAFNTPAIDASAIRYEVQEGSIFRDEEEVQNELRRGLMRMCRARARESIPLVREIGRRKTEEFVQNWLLQTFAGAEHTPVEVRFSDELRPSGAPENNNPR